MRFSICNELFEGWDLNRTCATIKRMGYDGVEIAPFTFGKSIYDISSTERAQLREIIEGNDLSMVGFHWLLAYTDGMQINSPDKEIRDKTARYLIDLTQLCADLGGEVMVFGSPKERNIPSGLSRQQAWAYTVDTFRRVLPALEERNVVLCLEPLSSQETNFINTAAEAAGMVYELRSKHFQLVLDVKAMATESTSIPSIIYANDRIIKHFHANDANRRGPGFGDTDFRPIFDALREIRYKGWISVEAMDYRPDPETVAVKSLEYLKKISLVGAFR